MLLSFFAASAISIYPVEISNPLLRQEDTHVSDAARAIITDSSSQVVHCMELPRHSSRFARTCLAPSEWQRVLELAQLDATRQEAVEDRNRSIALAHWNAR